MKIFKNLLLLFLVVMPSIALSSDATNGTKLPFNLYIDAIMEMPEYDPQFDYLLLKTTKISTNLNTSKNLDFNKKIVNKVVVKKSQYRMYLYHNDRLIVSFLIALGKNPQGHKVYEGDKRTPEGKYILDYVNLNSRFHKDFHISYPNVHDIENARKIGKNPGGMIMVHGQPLARGDDKDELPGLQASNWTDGCIALMNYDMDRFIELVGPGTPIIIEP